MRQKALFFPSLSYMQPLLTLLLDAGSLNHLKIRKPMPINIRERIAQDKDNNTKVIFSKNNVFLFNTLNNKIKMSMS